jgi:hypothetical protein
MYINYINDRQDLDFICLKDKEDAKQVTVILKTGVIYIIFINYSLFMVDKGLIKESYLTRPFHEKVILSVSNQKLNIQTVNKLRGGTNNLSENTNKNEQRINDSLKESVRFDNLQKNLVSKSIEDLRSFNGKSFNKIFIKIIDKLEPVLGNPKFLRLLVEAEKPVKSEISIKPSYKKNIIDSKTKKISHKRSSSLFAEALVPINPGRWPAFAAGSFTSSDMPDITDKLQNPLDNLRAAKEYLETAQSDIQWRDRFWKITQDTTTINVASEIGGDLGSFGAGALSNKIADGYINEMVDTALTLNQQEKLNLEIFKQSAREQGVDVSKVRGTGLTREFVPDYMEGDICDRPERNSRPNFWEDASCPYDDESFFN